MPSSAHVLTHLHRAYAAARTGAASTSLRLAAFVGLALAAKWQVLSQAGTMVDTVDVEHFSLFEDVARTTVAKFHELPFWNPYYCGGLTGLGTPSARFASPTFLLTLLFGTLRAEPLILMVMAVVGLEGAYRYVHARGGGAMGAFMCAPIFALCGCFPRWSTFSWTNFYGFELIPWVLLGTRETFRGSRRGVVVLALSLAFMIGFGGTYAAPLTALAALWEALGVVWARRRQPGYLGRVAVIAGAAFCFVLAMSLVRLWPIAETLGASPRILGGTEGTPIRQVFRDLFGLEGGKLAQVWQALRSHKPSTPRADYYVGWLALPIFVLGCFRRRALPFVASSLVWLWLSLGYSVGLPLFAVLRMVPPFTMLRAPERVLPLFVLGYAVVTALALRRVEQKSRKRPAFVLVAFLFVAMLGQNLYVLVRNDGVISKARPMIPAPAVVDRPFHQTRGNRWLSFYYMQQSRGTLACFDDYNVAESTELRGDLGQEEFLRDTGAGSVTEKAWAPNRLDLSVALSRPARLYINQNWHPGWHANEGTVVDDHGLLAVDLPAGSRDVVLRFLPRSGIVGGLTSLAALGVAALVWLRTKNREDFGLGRDLRREALLFASPLAVACLGWAGMREPHRPRAPLLTPDGEPLVASAPPEGATPVGALWTHEGITLEAVRIDKSPAPDDGDTYVTLELDWRLSKKVPAGLAVSVRVDRTAQGTINLDYAQLSGSLLFDDAPTGVTLRDVRERLVLAKGDEPLAPRVFVALYYARRDNRPLTDVEGSGLALPDGRISVGSFDLP